MNVEYELQVKTLKNQWDENLQTLKDKHQVIANLLKDKRIAYVDIPTHFNVGDLLIWEGTEQFFRDNSLKVVYRCDAKKYNLSKIENADVIAFHGGGSFGDLYDDGQMQQMRESLVKRFPNKRIVCFPQTIHFQNDERFKRSSELFSQHKDFHFFVRDAVSFELAQSFTGQRYLMPDMAHSLHPLVDVQEAVVDIPSTPRVLNLSRVDKEQSGSSVRLQKRSFDWVQLLELQDIAFNHLSILLKKVPGFEVKGLSIWFKVCEKIVFRAKQYFYQFDAIETDRLHGCILGVLLGRNIKFFDNSYGKNSTYYEMWLQDNPLIQMVDSTNSPTKPLVEEQAQDEK